MICWICDWAPSSPWPFKLSILLLPIFPCSLHFRWFLRTTHRDDRFSDCHVGVQCGAYSSGPIPVHPLWTAVPAMGVSEPGASINSHNLDHWYANTTAHLINCFAVRMPMRTSHWIRVALVRLAIVDFGGGIGTSKQHHQAFGDSTMQRTPLARPSLDSNPPH